MAKACLLPLLLLLPLALSVISVSAFVYAAINCGASNTVVDGVSSWFGDSFYVENGERRVVQSPASVPLELRTLRVFSSRKKNCYSIIASDGDRVIARASFYYGNYDKKSSPPTFDLHFGANHWATVVTSLTDVVYYEAIYIVKGNSVNICLAQTKPNQFPFISSLEVMSLATGMYSHVDSNYPLFLRNRAGFGKSGTVRSPDDSYGRLWVPATVSPPLSKITSNGVLMIDSIEDDPPRALLKSAVTPPNSSRSMTLDTNLPQTEVPIYINMYFAEMFELGSAEIRSFQINIDNKPSSDPIYPPYESAVESHISNITASASTSFSLVSTLDSTLPPIISAMEVFQVGNPISNGTKNKDVEALGLLQSQFYQLKKWSSDPCLPAPFTWDWLNCSSDDPPRVTALYLNGFELFGLLPDFSAMDALEIIHLHNNSLNGDIPEFLGMLPKLKELNLAGNSFDGTIPASLSKNKNLKLDVSGNPKVCASSNCGPGILGTSPRSTGRTDNHGNTPYATDGLDTPYAASGDLPPDFSGNIKSSKKLLPIIVGITIPSLFLLWAIGGVVAILHHKRKSATISAITAGQQMEMAGKPLGPDQQAMPPGFNPVMPDMNGQNPMAIGSEPTAPVEYRVDLSHRYNQYSTVLT